MDSLAVSQRTGDLPSAIEINPDLPGAGDEGTALLEIVHDMAPAAGLAFSSSETSLEMVRSIEWLANEAFGGEGADLIVDDLGYYHEPFFEDGPVALAAAEAVASGIVFVSASGNHADGHYEADYVDGGDGYHAFRLDDTAMAVRVSEGADIVLQWNDKYGQASNDYDLFLCQRGHRPTRFNLQNDVCLGSTGLQDGDDDPIEQISVDETWNADSDLYIHRYSGASANRLEMFVIGGVIEEYGVQQGGVVGHPAVDGVIAVGAIYSNDPGHDDSELYSDRGPAEIFFPARETRTKPDLMASDGVSLSGAGDFQHPFYGTSAATPHAAAAAALVLEAIRRIDPAVSKKDAAEAVYEALVNTAVDLGEPGPDNTFGYGRVEALAAVASIGQLDGVTFTVDSDGDGDDADVSDGICADLDDNCTLRAAIQQANEGTGGIIKFNIAGSGPHTIQPASALPIIARAMIIDGFSQPGASRDTVLIELDGTNAGEGADGLTLAVADSEVRGLAVNRFKGNGIVVESGGGQLIEGNLIGTSAGGDSDQGNAGAGVLIDGVSGVTVRNNVISGNGSHGVSVSGANSSGNLVVDNVIGADASGSDDLGNGGSGIHVSGAPHNVIESNLISGNDSHGITLTGNATKGSEISGNSIGANKAGDGPLANTGSGVHITDGSSSGRVEHNLIAFNGGDGVSVDSSTALKNSIRRNYFDANTGLAIDLSPDGITDNDPGDRDSGPNNLQNYPTVTAVALKDNAAAVEFSLDGSAGRLYVVDFYTSDSCDASRNGEGTEWLGYALVQPVRSGTAHYNVSSIDGGIRSLQPQSGGYLSATATLTDGLGVDGDTSEFSTRAGKRPDCQS